MDGSKAATASLGSSAGSRPMRRSRRRVSTRPATPRPRSTGALAQLSGRSATDTRSELGARFDTSAGSIPMRCWRCALGSLGRTTGSAIQFSAIPGASRRELHRQRRAPATERCPSIGRWGASLRQWDHVTGQVRRRVRLALIDLRRNGDVPIQVVRETPDPSEASGDGKPARLVPRVLP